MVSFWGCSGSFAARRLGPSGPGDLQLLLEKFGPLAELIVVERTDWMSSSRGSGFGVGGVGAGREQGSGLDVDQQGRDVDEVGAEIDVELLGAVEVIEVLPGDLSNGDIGDLDLVFANEGEQQIEGSFEAGKGNLR